MTATRAEGVRLLTDEAAAEHAGVHVETIWAWREMGLIEPVMTPEGLRYPLHAVEAVLSGETLPRKPEWTAGYLAARILGCGPASLRRYVRLGLLHTDGRGHYDVAELEAFRDARGAPRTD